MGGEKFSVAIGENIECRARTRIDFEKMKSVLSDKKSTLFKPDETKGRGEFSGCVANLSAPMRHRVRPVAPHRQSGRACRGAAPAIASLIPSTSDWRPSARSRTETGCAANAALVIFAGRRRFSDRAAIDVNAAAAAVPLDQPLRSAQTADRS